MILALLLNAAWAIDGDVVSTSLVQARPDMTGQPYLSAWQNLWGSARSGAVWGELYGDLAWPSGVDRAWAPELYVLSVDGEGQRADWTLGRQRIELPTWGRMLDGARGRWDPSPNLALEAWGGFAHHTGFDGFTTGVPLARLAATYQRQVLRATAGVWGELAETAALHADLRVRLDDADDPLTPDASAIVAVGFGPDGPTWERLRLEGSMRPARGLRAMAFAEHRQALLAHSPGESDLGSSVLGPSILATFAPSGTDELGLGLGWTTARRSRLWSSAALTSWSTDEGGPELGARAELRWQPLCDRRQVCVSPTWSGVRGPGGLYHSVGAVTSLPVPDALRLDLHTMLVPYRKPFQPWDTVLVGGVRSALQPTGGRWSLALHGELARDAIAPLDARAWLAFQVGTTPGVSL